MKFFSVIILSIMIVCGSVLDLKSENEKFIQGKWKLAGTIPGDRKIAWLLEWEFADGEFTQSGYPPILQKGKYKILEDKDQLIKLKLYQQDGTFGDQERELIIKINRENKSLTIDTKEGFKKVIEKKQE